MALSRLSVSPSVCPPILDMPELTPAILVLIESNLIPNNEPIHLITAVSLSIRTLNTALI